MICHFNMNPDLNVTFEYIKEDKVYVIKLTRKSGVVGEYIAKDIDSALDLYNEIKSKIKPHENSRAESYSKGRRAQNIQ